MRDYNGEGMILATIEAKLERLEIIGLFERQHILTNKILHQVVISTLESLEYNLDLAIEKVKTEELPYDEVIEYKSLFDNILMCYQDQGII